MSLAPIAHVKKSQKPNTPCEKCGVELPKGSAYRYFYVGYRSNAKRVRCAKPECTPRPSELESSKLAEVYAAQEDAQDQLDRLDIASTKEEITEIVSNFGDRVQEVADEYADASTNDNGTTFNTTAEERGETLSGVAGEILNFSVSDSTLPCDSCEGDGTTLVNENTGDTEDCPDCDGLGTAFDWEGAVDEARDALNIDL